MIHFYHVYADGQWETPVTEHINALQTSDILRHLNDIYIGIVGQPNNRIAVVRAFHNAGIYPQVAAEANEGWEHVTLEPLRKRCTSDDPILYAHTKGSANISDINTGWRKSMTYWNVIQWRQALTHLQTVDCVGCHWIQEGQFFGGNFWWANSKYLRTLPPLDYTSRYHAEIWIGQNPDQKKHDLNPGWPDPALFTTEW